MVKNSELLMPLTFLVRYCDSDRHLLSSLEGEITSLYPDAFLIKVPDGEGGYFKREHLADWLLLGFSRAQERSMGQWIVSLDPDSQLHRKFSLPSEKTGMWHGQVIHASSCKTVWGCGALMSRTLIGLTLENKELFRSRHADLNPTYSKGNENIPSRDILLGIVLNELNIYPQEWAANSHHKEVKLSFEYGKSFESGKWAITHPRKPLFDFK